MWRLRNEAGEEKRMNTTGLATIGTSKITEKFLDAVSSCPDCRLAAVYSRDPQKAKTFAAAHAAERFYHDLDELAADPKVTAVYIASPNHMHYEQTMKLLNAGKHVLCEKSIASNERQAREMFALAHHKGAVLLEAMRSVFDPGAEAVRGHLEDIGPIRMASIRFCQYSSRYDSFKEGRKHNIFRRDCSAGALMDIGVYCVHMLLYLFGEPEEVSGYSVMLRGEIDGAGTVTARYRDKVADLAYSKITGSFAPNILQGEKGTLEFWGKEFHTENVVLQNRAGQKEVLYRREPVNDMQYELEHFLRMIRGEETADAHECRTLSAMRLMDRVRRQCGIVFPADRK